MMVIIVTQFSRNIHIFTKFCECKLHFLMPEYVNTLSECKYFNKNVFILFKADFSPGFQEVKQLNGFSKVMHI